MHDTIDIISQIFVITGSDPGPLFTKWMDVLTQDLQKSQIEAARFMFPIALKFDKHPGSPDRFEI